MAWVAAVAVRTATEKAGPFIAGMIGTLLIYLARAHCLRPLVQPSLSLTPVDVAVVARVEQDTDAATVAKFARAFTARVRSCNAKSQINPDTAQTNLEVWLANNAASGVRAMETFAAGLKSDVAAISAALAMP